MVEGKHNTSIDGLSEAAFSIPAIDVVMERQHEKSERRRVASAMVSQIRDKLTETQFRRPIWINGFLTISFQRKKSESTIKPSGKHGAW